MQNTIIKEFAGNPDVFTALFNQAGSWGETRDWLEEFWSNYYLRGGIIFDSLGHFADSVYDQPDTGLPFGRGFIIDRDGRIAVPYFGHHPAMAIAKIYELLGATSVPEGDAGAQGARRGASGLSLIAEVRPVVFREGTTIQCTLPASGRASVRVFDTRGRTIRTLLDEVVPAGTVTVRWDGRDARGAVVGPGVYLCVIEAPGVRGARTVVKVR